MIALEIGHVLVSADIDDLFFHHYDESGILLETISIPGFVPGSGTYVYNFVQFGTRVYTTTIDPGEDAFKIQEWDENLNFVRDVVTKIDMSNPIQNPSGYNPVFGQLLVENIALDEDGNIYGNINKGSDQRTWVWNNDGDFLRTFLPTNTANVHNSLLINPGNPCELVQIRNGGAPDTSVYRYDICNEVIIDTISLPQGQGSAPTGGDFNCDGHLHFISLDYHLHVYDLNYSEILDLPLTGPITTLSNVALYATPTNNSDFIWITGQRSGLGGYEMYQYQLSINAVVLGPILLNSTGIAVDTFVYRNCVGGVAGVIAEAMMTG